MAYENGVNWKPEEPENRGRHGSFNSALDAAVGDMLRVRNDFFDSLADNWKRIFPDLPARPGRYEDGKIFLYVRNAPTLFLMRGKLAAIKRRIAALPGAPRRIELRLEAKAS
jgi:hypothetical protein